MGFPRARRFANVSIEWVGDEAVVLIPETLEYHAFSGRAYEVWQAADGTRSEDELAELVFGDRSVESVKRVDVAIDALGAAGLLEGVDPDSPSLLSRRRVTKLAAAGLLGAVGLPVVKSITVPAAASAFTRIGDGGPGATCGFGLGGCVSGCCCAGSPGSTTGNCTDRTYCTVDLGYACI